MSFRSRLLLFFTIIVVIPMIAVALVLFSLTADSETGKADAQIGQAMRSAFAIYQQDRDAARRSLDAIAGDARLGTALAHPGNGAAVRRRIQALLRQHPSLRAIAAYDLQRRLIAAVGAPDAIAPAAATPSTSKGQRLGLVAVASTRASEYAREVEQTTALAVRVLSGGRLLASTLSERGTFSPKSGDVTIAGRKYRGRFATLANASGPPVQVGVFEEGSSLRSAIEDRRLLIGAILAAFLVLALLSSIVVVRALQNQVQQFLEAARRLAHGDFSEPVPSRGRRRVRRARPRVQRDVRAARGEDRRGPAQAIGARGHHPPGRRRLRGRARPRGDGQPDAAHRRRGVPGRRGPRAADRRAPHAHRRDRRADPRAGGRAGGRRARRLRRAPRLGEPRLDGHPRGHGLRRAHRAASPSSRRGRRRARAGGAADRQARQRQHRGAGGRGLDRQDRGSVRRAGVRAVRLPDRPGGRVDRERGPARDRAPPGR